MDGYGPFQEEREEREAAGEDTEQGGSDGPSLNGDRKRSSI